MIRREDLVLALSTPALTNFWRDQLLVSGLWALAVAQPILAVAGDHPEVLSPGPGGALVQGILLLAGPPLAWMVLQGVLGRLRPSAVRPARAFACSVLLALLVLQVTNRYTEHVAPALVLVAAAVTVGAGVGAAGRWKAVRSFGEVVALASLLVAALALLRLPAPQALAGRWGGQSAVPIVWVVFDELPLTTMLEPEGRIDGRNFPNFAALAERSTWYRRATTVSGTTQVALPAMLTGRYPAAAGVPPTAGNYPGNLLQLLGQSHQVRAYEPMTSLAPPPEAGDLDARESLPTRSLALLYARFVVPRSLHGLLPSGDRDAAVFAGREFRYDDEVARFLQTAASMRRSPRPPLYFLHSLVPHRPWRRYPSGHSFGSPVADLFPDNRLIWSSEPWQAVQAYQAHLMQSAFADRLLGLVVARLKQSGLYDSCLLVVVADHGVCFVPGRDDRTEVTPAQFMHVPMFVKLPGQVEGRVDDRCVETVDLFPTVLAAAGAAVPEGLDGRSLLGEEELRDSRYLLATTGPWQGPRDLDGIEEMTAWRGRLLGPEGTLQDLFRLAPGEGHVGSPGSSLVPVPGVTASVDRPEQYRGVDAQEPIRPGPVSGTVLAPEGARTVAVSVVVDGVVRAETLAWRGKGGMKFMALLPESTWTAGDHAVEAIPTALDPQVDPELLPPSF